MMDEYDQDIEPLMILYDKADESVRAKGARGENIREELNKAVLAEDALEEGLHKRLPKWMVCGDRLSQILAAEHKRGSAYEALFAAQYKYEAAWLRRLQLIAQFCKEGNVNNKDIDKDINDATKQCDAASKEYKEYIDEMKAFIQIGHERFQLP